jgi:hypothetical protein
MMYYILKNTHCVSAINLSGFDLRMDILMKNLSPLVGLEPRLPRLLLNLRRFAQTFVLWRAIYLTFDLGIGGLDRGRLFEVSDFALMDPLLVCTDAITFFVAELLPTFQPIATMDVLQELRILLEPRLAGIEPNAKGYYVIDRFYNRKIASAAAHIKCDALAKQLNQALGDRHECRVIFCELAHLSNNIVYEEEEILNAEGQTVKRRKRIPAIEFPDPETDEKRASISALHIHKSVFERPVTPESVLEAWSKGLHPLTPTTTVLRGKLNKDTWTSFKLQEGVANPRRVLERKIQQAEDDYNDDDCEDPHATRLQLESLRAQLEFYPPDTHLCDGHVKPLQRTISGALFTTTPPLQGQRQSQDIPQVYPPRATPEQKMHRIESIPGKKQATPFLDYEIIQKHLLQLKCFHPDHYAFPHNLQKVLQGISVTQQLIQGHQGKPPLPALVRVCVSMWDTYIKHHARPADQVYTKVHIQQFLMGLGLNPTWLSLEHWEQLTEAVNHTGQPPPLEGCADMDL